MLRGAARRNQQKDAERRVNSENHLFVFRLIWLPAPATRPQEHHEWIHADQEDQAHQRQNDLQRTFLFMAPSR